MTGLPVKTGRGRRWNGFWFDCLLLGVTLLPFHLLLSPAATPVANESAAASLLEKPEWIGAVCLAAWLAQAVGAWLKRQSRQPRTWHQGRAPEGLGFILLAVILLPHWVSFGLLEAIFWPVVQEFVPDHWWFWLPLSFVPSGLAGLCLQRAQADQGDVSRAHLADALLGVALIPLGIVWDLFVQAWAARSDPFEGFAYICVWFVILYFGPRILFLMDDGRDWRTWARAAVVFVALVLRLVG